MKNKVMLLATAIMLTLVGSSSADFTSAKTPRGEAQSLASADYGGVLYSTCAFCGLLGPIGFSTVSAPTDKEFAAGKLNKRGVFYGVIFSSGLGGAYDFVDVYDSTSTRQAEALGDSAKIGRFYNVNGSTTSGIASNSAAASGFSGPRWPIRFQRGLMIRHGSATNGYNNTTTLYYQEP